jgi:hypothetical protein
MGDSLILMPHKGVNFMSWIDMFRRVTSNYMCRISLFVQHSVKEEGYRSAETPLLFYRSENQKTAWRKPNMYRPTAQ